jgi:subtilisin-like proprotein convertase family protein
MSFLFVRQLRERWLGGNAGRSAQRRKTPRVSRQARATRPGLEQLEDRTLLASNLPVTTPTLPEPTVIAGSQMYFPVIDNPNTQQVISYFNGNSPTIVTDPLDPQKMVMVATVGNTIGSLPTHASGVVMSYSTDGGRDWYTMLADTAFGDSRQFDPRKDQRGPFQPYDQVSDASVAFDRQHNFYIIDSQHSAGFTRGELILYKFDFSQTNGTGGNSPVSVETNPDNTGATGTFVTKLYQWDTDDPALNPTIAIDTNVPTFTDPQTGDTQTDPNTNPGDPLHPPIIYVAWNTNNTVPRPFPGGSIPNFNPFVIKMIASDNGGATFTGAAYVNDGIGSNPNVRFVNAQINEMDSHPQIVFSQGTTSSRVADTGTQVPAPDSPFDPFYDPVSSVPGGQMSVFWNNDGVSTIASDNISGSALNASSAVFTGPVGGINHAVVNPAGGPDIPIPSIFTVNHLAPGNFITDPNFSTVSDVNVIVNIQDPNMDQLRLFLQWTNAAGTVTRRATLIRNRVDNAGTTIGNPPVGLPGGPDLGEIAFDGTAYRQLTDTLFDQQAPRQINDLSYTVPWGSDYQAEGDAFGDFVFPGGDGDGFSAGFPGFNSGGLNVFNGLTKDEVNTGTWELVAIDYRSDGTTPPPQEVDNWTINITSKYNATAFTFGTDKIDPTTGIETLSPPALRANLAPSTSRPGPIAGHFDNVFTAPNGLTAAPSADLGIGPSYALAVDNTLGSFSPYQGRMYLAFTGHVNRTAADTNIYLVYSDDAGASWHGAPDGVNAYGIPIQINDDAASDNMTGGNRFQFQPSIAVDPLTGTLVATWYDARTDAANARVSRYIATSVDGGLHWSQQTYLNASRTAVDAITNTTINMEPIPDNDSAGNANRDTTWGFGQHQGLVVYGGHVQAVWVGNQNASPQTGILTATATIPAGPRIVFSDMGPVVNEYTYTNPDEDPTNPKSGQTTTYNSTFTVDGVRRIDSFVVQFDRPVDPASFTPSDVIVQYRDPNNDAISVIPVTSVRALNDGTISLYPAFRAQRGTPTSPLTGGPAAAPNALATTFIVSFAAQARTGTYSYSVRDVEDRIRDIPLPTNSVITSEPVVPVTDVFFVSTPPTTLPPGTHAAPFTYPDLAGSGTPPFNPPADVVIDVPPLPAGEVIADVKVHVSINDPFPARLQIALISPKGTRVVLANQEGLSFDPTNTNISYYNDVTFDDNAYFPITAINQDGVLSGSPQSPSSVSPPLPVTQFPHTLEFPENTLAFPPGTPGTSFRPEQFTSDLGGSPPSFFFPFGAPNALSAFRGEDTTGIWKLEVRAFANVGAGTINSWNLQITGGLPASNVTSNDTSKVITPGGTATSSITIPAGSGITVGQVKVRLDSLTHTNPENLFITLTGPNGVTVVLSDPTTDAPPAGYVDFVNTVFDDNAHVMLSGAGAVSPVPDITGTFTPALPATGVSINALSQFLGIPADGTWTLTVTDTGTGLGTLDKWSLILVPVTQGNWMDQDGDAVTKEGLNVNANNPPLGSPLPANLNDVYSVPRPVKGISFQLPYSQDTLPLIIPGPHLAPPAVYTTSPTVRVTSIDVVGTTATVTLATDIGLAVGDHVAIDGANESVFDSEFVVTAVDLLAMSFDVTVPAGSPATATGTLTVKHLANLAVPPAGTGGTGSDAGDLTTSTITVSGVAADEEISKLTVNVRLLHNPDDGQGFGFFGNNADLVFTLVAPDGTRLLLAKNNFGDPTVSLGLGSGYINRHFANTTFDDQAQFPIDPQILLPRQTGPFIGTFRPQLLDPDTGLPTGTNLTLFNGKNPNGDWHLEVRDTKANDNAVLKEWSLTIATTRVVLNNNTDHTDVTFDRDMDPNTFTGANILRVLGPQGEVSPFNPANPTAPRFAVTSLSPRTFRITFLNPDGTTANIQTINGQYVVLINPASPNPGTVPPIQSVGSSEDPSESPPRPPDALDTNLNAGVYKLFGNTPYAPTVSVSSSVGNTTIVPPSNTGQPIPGGQTITSKITIAPNFLVRGATVKLNITHPNDPDLQVTLVSPQGTRVLLVARGTGNNPGNHANFSGTVLDDNAKLPLRQGSPPFTGTFNPQTPLSVLLDNASAGDWKLEIQNFGTQGGTLNSWTLTLQEAQNNSGLGETLPDQITSSFQIFTMSALSDLSRVQWTAVGPQSLNNNGNAGRVTSIVVDPIDPSGNTVYVGAASGGVWKTTNFLTTDPKGPTYIPLTDFAYQNGLNIGALALLDVNNDQTKTKVWAGTGDVSSVGANPALPSTIPARGIGFLYSADAGQTWTLLDSTDNTKPFAQRDHAFVGAIVNKIVVDPRVSAVSGLPIVYAALTDGTSTNKGGLWRSTDGGLTWLRARAGQATDVIFDFSSASATTHNLQTLFAGFQTEGVFFSGDQGQGWIRLDGGLGNPNILDGDPLPANPPAQMAVANNGSPSGNKGRIILAKPAPTNNPVTNFLYKDWLYAGVADANGNLDGLYVSKDATANGANWTKVSLPQTIPFVPYPFQPQDPPPSLGFGTNDTNRPQTDPLGATGSLGAVGNRALVLAIDPTNPEVVYLGGQNVIRVDITKLNDPHNVTVGNYQAPDGGNVSSATNASSSMNYRAPVPPDVLFPAGFDGAQFSGTAATLRPAVQYTNLNRDPNDVFRASDTLLTTNVNGWNNQGTGAFWQPYTQITQPNPFDQFSTRTTGLHQMLTLVDPTTGRARLIFGDDQGVYSVLDQGDGTLITGVGTQLSAVGARNGNLQIAQFFQGAVQPSVVAGEIANAMFLGTSQENGTHDQSTGHILDTGFLGWSSNGFIPGLAFTPVFTNPQQFPPSLLSDGDPYGSGNGVATDPGGSGTTYHNAWPQTMTFPSSFLDVSGPGAFPAGQTTGLIQPGDNPATGAGQWTRPGETFAVNPIDGTQLVMSSRAGRIFRTRTGQFALSWSQIGFINGDVNATGINVLDGTYAGALAYGAPDPSNPLGNTDDFIYAGTDGGKVFVTFNGGARWTNISTGLDGTPVKQIVTNPSRGTFDAYAVTEQGVYHLVGLSRPSPDINSPPPAGARWVNITANLFNLTRVPFAETDPNAATTQAQFAQTVLGGAATAALAKATNPLTSIVADWRFKVPDAPGSATVHPFLYVAGYGGVFRSIDNGATWTVFPNNQTVTSGGDGSPVNGGYLPAVPVTSLSLSAGNIDPTSGLPHQNTGPNMLVATTFGRGTFAIRLPNNSAFNRVEGPFIIAVSPTTTVSPSDGLGTGGTAVTFTFNETIDPSTLTFADPTTAQVHLFYTPPGGAAVAITIKDIIDLTPAVAGQANPHTHFQLDFDHQMGQGTYTLTIGPNVTDFAGNAMDQNLNLINGQPGVAPAGDIFLANFQVTGLRVIATNPLPAPATSPPGLAAITVAFTLGVEASSITAAGAVTLVGPTGPIAVTVTDATTGPGGTNKHDVWLVSFDPQFVLGTYTLTVDKSVMDLTGGFMDQNANGTQGETGVAPAGDSFQANFLVATSTVTPPGGGGSISGVIGSGAITFLRGPIRRIRNTHRFRQRIQVFNTGSQPIQGPIALVLDGLTRRVKLRNKDGVTQVFPPLGQPYKLSVVSVAQLQSFEGATYILEFANPREKKIRYTPRLIGGFNPV